MKTYKLKLKAIVEAENEKEAKRLFIVRSPDFIIECVEIPPVNLLPVNRKEEK